MNYVKKRQRRRLPLPDMIGRWEQAITVDQSSIFGKIFELFDLTFAENWVQVETINYDYQNVIKIVVGRHF